MGQETEFRKLRGFGDTTVMLHGREVSLDAPAATPLPEVAYSFDAQGETERRWAVQHFEVTEGLSLIYECVLDLAAEAVYENADTMLGKYALLQVQRDTVLRRFFGVVRRVEHRGTTATHRLARVFVVPALWTLSQRSDARIFQGVTALDVVKAVLHEAGLYAGMLDVRVQRKLPVREYCVQYRETDLAFVMRLLEEEGITFFFRHEEETETLVLADGPHAWDAVRTMDGGAVPIAGAEMSTQRVEAVRSLVWEREQRPTGVAVRDFDFTRPGYQIGRMAPRKVDGVRSLYDPAPTLVLGQYAGAAYTQENGQEQAQLRLEAERTNAAVGTGEGVVVGMIPGALFQVTLVGAHIPKQRYLVTRVEHVGDAPEVLVVGERPKRAEEDRYRNRFQCMPMEVPFRPKRETPRPVIAGPQTATVTGPAGEEIYTDEHGRIKVQFHWDRRGRHDEQSSCWVRAVQGPWSGNGWGFQFIPRVGMEVVVTFLEGDPDRPLVTGSVFNGMNRPTFGLPEERTRNGVRTQTVGGGGHNEISFEDLAGREQVYLHAQRDHDEVVEHDHTLRVGNDEMIHVAASRVDQVGRNRTTAAGADSVDTVQGDRRETSQGHVYVGVGRDQTVEIEGDRYERVGGKRDVLVTRDHTTRVEGHSWAHTRDSHTLMVGTHEAKRPYALLVEGTMTLMTTERAEISSTKEIVLTCGTSRVRITPDKIEFVADTVAAYGKSGSLVIDDQRVATGSDKDILVRGKTVEVQSRQGAGLKLDTEAELGGAKVKLAPPPGRVDAQRAENAPGDDDHLVLRLRLGFAETVRYELSVGRNTYAGQLHPDEVLEHEVPSLTGAGELKVWSARYSSFEEAGEDAFVWDLDIGSLDELDPVSAVQARLNNLGYVSGAVDGNEGPVTQSAILSFQNAHSVAEPDGRCGDAVLATVIRAHGS